MKSIFALFIGLTLSANLFSQRNFWTETRGVFYKNTNYQVYGGPPEQQESFKKHNIKSKTTTHYSKKFSNEFKEFFDQEGYLIKRKYLSSKLETETNITYNAERKITKVETTNNKGEKWTSTTTYEHDLAVEVENIDEKGKYSGSKKTYNEDGLMTRHQRFEKSRTEPTHELIYTYYEGGSKKNIIYNENGKLKYEWNFDCKEEGELVDIKSKDKSTICIKEEIDPSGNMVIWNREFDEKGKLIKTKVVKTADDKLISREVFNQADRLLTKTEMKEEGGVLTESYDKNGEVSSKRESFVNSAKKIVKFDYSSKGFNYTQIYAYEGDLRSTYSRISKRRISVDQYQYEYY